MYEFMFTVPQGYEDNYDRSGRIYSIEKWMVDHTAVAEIGMVLESMEKQKTK
jgi:hypothetical protein